MTLGRLSHLGLLMGLGLTGSCGGPQLESKVANALQTVMSNVVEAFLLSEGTETTVNCSGGGTLSFSGFTPFDPLDPFAPLASNLPVVFDNCSIKVCGDEITFINSGTLLISIGGIDPAQIISNGGSVDFNETQSLEVDFVASDQKVSGFINGEISFGYILQTIGNSEGLSAVKILPSNSTTPLELNSKKYKSTEIKKLAERC